MANLPQIEQCDFFFLSVHMKYTFYKYWSGVKTLVFSIGKCCHKHIVY